MTDIIRKHQPTNVKAGVILSLIYALSPHSCLAVEAFNELSVDVSYLDNVGLSSVENDKTKSSILEVNAARFYRKTLGVSESVNYGANLRTRSYSNYPCNQASVGIALGYRKKLGLGFDKPIFSATWSGTRHVYNVSARNRLDSEVSLSVSRPFGEHWDASISLSKRWEIPDRISQTVGLPDSLQDIASNALDKESIQVAIATEYYASSTWSFPASLSFSNGDITSGARYRPALSNDARAISNDVGMGNNWYIYRYEGSAWSASLNASRLLSDGSSLNFGISRVDARSDGNIRYDRNSLSISWIKNW